MKKTITIFTTVCCLLATFWANAQERYEEEIFTEVSVTHNVVYGVNGTLLYLSDNDGHIKSENLLMDIYEPVGDTQEERPVVLVFHTGNFLPPVLNGQIAGTKYDSSSVEICTQLAKRGFTAASVTYRLGWNPLAASQPEKALGLIQAAYRGVQDGRAAVRFFRDSYENGNPYKIDPSRITAWGNGTGGYITLAMAGLSDYSEIVETTHPPGKFLLDVDSNGVGETPMVVEMFHGDIEGKVLTIVPVDGFGLLAGDTSNHANHVNYSSDIHLCMNVGGALGDISWLDDNIVPMITVQSPYDQFAPYDDDILTVPTTGDPIVQVQGAKKIGEWMENNGINQPWKDQGFDDAVTMEAIDFSMPHGMHPFYEGIYPFYNPPNSFMQDEGVVINWWDPQHYYSAYKCLHGPSLESMPPFDRRSIWQHQFSSGRTFYQRRYVSGKSQSQHRKNHGFFHSPSLCSS